MTDNILTDSEKLKKVLDEMSQNNSKTYETAKESEKTMTITPEVMPEIPTIMSKDQYDGLVELNEKHIKKQLKKKKEDGVIGLRKEIDELKEVMRLQMEIDKMRNQKVSNTMVNKPQYMDSIMTTPDELYVDFTQYVKRPIQTPTVQGSANINPTPKENFQRPFAKLPESTNLNSKIVENPQKMPVNPEKKEIKVMNQGLKETLFWVSACLSLVLLTAIMRFLFNATYFAGLILSFIICFFIFMTIYFVKIKVPDHQLKKEQVQFNNFELAEAKRCELCGDKLIKSKVKHYEDSYSQSIKCKNINCPFQKTISFIKEGKI